MSYLVDANVLSESTRRVPNPRVMGWMARHERELFVDPIVLGEVRLGILKLPRGKKRLALENWFAAVVETFECLPWDTAVSQKWAELVASLRSKGRNLPTLDGMIAATALTHNLTIATHNVRDFQMAGVSVV